MKIFFNKIAILGVGLIGGSFALAMKKNGLCREITGFGRDSRKLRRAKEKGIVDSFHLDASVAVRDADLIMFATPVGTFLDLSQKIASALKKGALVTDVGSIKGSLVRKIEKIMPDGVHYVGGHPIAGSDSSGFEAADADLFMNAAFIMTPTQNSDKEALAAISALWETLGSVVVATDAEEHDRIFAAVSHLPHVIAYALVNTAADIDRSYLKFSGQGFRDTTRIAASSPELWRDICLMNKRNLLEMIDIFKKNLDSISQYLRADDAHSLEGEFDKARALREGIGQN